MYQTDDVNIEEALSSASDQPVLDDDLGTYSGDELENELDDSEFDFNERLLSSEDQLFTPEDISRAAKILRAKTTMVVLPTIEKQWGKQVIRKIVKSNVIERYFDNRDHEENIVFKRDVTCLIGRISYYVNTTSITKTLVDGGTVKRLIKECEHTEDEEVVSNITLAISTIAFDSGHYSHTNHLVKQGLLEILPKVIQKWRLKREGVVCLLLETLQNLTCASTGVKVRISRDESDNGLPVIVQDILATSTSTPVVEGVIRCISKMLGESAVLHRHFYRQDLVDTCFNRIKSGQLTVEYERYILRYIVTQLTCNNPSHMTRLLAPHAGYLREQAVLGVDRELSRTSADLVNKYLSCSKDKVHKCKLSNRLGHLKLFKFILFYVMDVVTDIIVGIKTINNEERSTGYEGYCILFFSIVPLVYINMLSIRRYYKSSFDYMNIDPVVALQGSSRGWFLKYIIPWKFNSLQHAMYNLLTLLQLHPIIAALEIVFHKPGRLSDIVNKRFHFMRLGAQEKILENVPCILIKGILFLNSGSSLQDQLFTMFSTLIGIMSLTMKVTDFEKWSRLADIEGCNTVNNLQKAVCFMGYLTSLFSRLFACVLLLYLFGTWIFGLCVVLHAVITFTIHLLSYHKRFLPTYFETSENRFVILDYLQNEGDEPNTNVVKFGRAALVLCLSWSEAFVVNLRHPIDMLSGDYPNTAHLRSPVYFFSLFTFNAVAVITVGVFTFFGGGGYLGYVSMGLYLFSGVMFILHYTVVHPDKKGKPPSLSLNPRYKHLDYNVRVYCQTCYVLPDKPLKINSTKVYRPEQYTYRLQVLKPCLQCMLNRKHNLIKSEESGIPHNNCCSSPWLTDKINRMKKAVKTRILFMKKCCATSFNFVFRRGHQRLKQEDTAVEEDISEKLTEEMEWLITKVRHYNIVQEDLSDYFPGIERIDGMDVDLINRCRELGGNVIRGVRDIEEDELDPGTVKECEKLRRAIEKEYSILLETAASRSSGDITQGELDSFSNLCEETLFWEESKWAEKVKLWCESAPTDIFSNYICEKWDTPEFENKLRKWVEDKERITDKHSKFYIN